LPLTDRDAQAAFLSDRSGLEGFVLQFLGVEIHESARKHGIATEEIEHAVSNAMAIEDQG
jgi:hypothetical protein